MTDSQMTDLLQSGSVFTTKSGQRTPCAPGSSWGSSPSELEFRSFMSDLMNYDFEPSFDLDSDQLREARHAQTRRL